ncbi:hypothetical protein [Halodesulfovibrio marinisediminis]|nr:hypothetical protein [Halodesulfovibrio marinisediminis]
MSEEEYNKRIAELLDKIQSTSSANEDNDQLFQRYRRAEFDLMVEYRLGADFSRDKWEKLRAVHDQLMEKVEKLRRAHAEGKLNQRQLLSKIQDFSFEMKKQYSKFLTEEEVMLLLGKEQQNIPFFTYDADNS